MRSAWSLIPPSLALLAACGGGSASSSSSSSPPATPPETAGPSASAPADDTPPPNTPFDRAAAARVLASVDPAPCYEKPPHLDAPLHVDLTLFPNGRVTEAYVGPPYAGTEAGKCAAALFTGLRVQPWVGPPVRMGRTVPHAPMRGNPNDPKFDPSRVRSAALAQDLSECSGLPGGGVSRGKATISVKPSGEVLSVAVDPPLGGSPRGECVARILKSLMYPPYSGDPALGVLVEFEIPTRRRD